MRRHIILAKEIKHPTLQDAITDTRAKNYAGIPNEVLNKENELKIKISFIEQQLIQKPGEEEERDLRNKLFDSDIPTGHKNELQKKWA
jgi:hypothetical protein